MPFQPIDFATIQPQGNPFFKNFIDNLMTGYQAGQLPQQLERQRQKEEVQNALNKLMLEEEPQKFEKEQEGRTLKNAFQALLNKEQPGKFGSEMATASIIRALHQADIDKIRKQMSEPFGGEIAPGAIGQSMWLERIRARYGENSPQYESAKKAYDSEIEKTDILNQYRTGLTGTLEKRSSTPLTKLELEQSDVEAGYKPGTGRTEKIGNPAQQQELLDTYGLKIQKERSDLDSRKRSLFASNIDKTIAQINIDDLTQYAGAKGGLSKLAEEAKAPFGKESQNYRNFQKSLVAAEFLAKQARQFYGDSIQPSMLERLEKLTNPASWINNPAIAKQNFETVKTILQKETGTYRGALKSTREFEEHGSSAKELTFNPRTGRLE